MKYFIYLLLLISSLYAMQPKEDYCDQVIEIQAKTWEIRKVLVGYEKINLPPHIKEKQHTINELLDNSVKHCESASAIIFKNAYRINDNAQIQLKQAKECLDKAKEELENYKDSLFYYKKITAKL